MKQVAYFVLPQITNNMDLPQTKLSKREWYNLEIPVSASEKKILKLIHDGFSNINIVSNDHKSLYSFTKIERNESTEIMLYEKYFKETMSNSINKYGKTI